MKMIESILDDFSECRMSISREQLREILIKRLVPNPALLDSEPVILYFRNKNDRKEFIEAVMEVNPSMRTIEL